MSVFFKSLLVASFALAATPLWAQNMAQEVLEEFAAEKQKVGYTVQVGSKTKAGSRVEWRDVVLTSPAEKIIIRYPLLTAQEGPIGQVKFSYPDQITYSDRSSVNGLGLEVTFTNRKLIDWIHKVDGLNVHRTTADQVGIVYKAPEIEAEFKITLNRVSADVQAMGYRLRRYQGDVQVKSVEVSYRLAGEYIGKMNFVDVHLFLDIDISVEGNEKVIIASKQSSLLLLDFGAGEHVLQITQKGFNGTIKTTTTASRYTLDIGKGVVKMGASAQNGQYELTFKDLPLPPLTVTAQALAFDIAIPVQKQEAPLQAGMVLRVQDIVASDSLWGMVDAAGILPREPANLVVDMSGGLNWFIDPMDNEALDTAKGQVAEVHDLTLKKLLLEIAGARLLGHGQMDIENSEAFTPGKGAFDFELIGGMGLMGKLVEMGLIEPQQRMIANVFAGMYAVPAGNGADHLKSHIETKAGGAIFVNGNQVQ